MLRQKAAFMKAEERDGKDGKKYRNVSLILEGASEALRFPVDETMYQKAVSLKPLQYITVSLQVDARINKGDWSASPTLKLTGFEVAQ